MANILNHNQQNSPLFLAGYRTSLHYLKCVLGGAEEDRTPDLLNAIQALSQLSYNPSKFPTNLSGFFNIGIK
jgi:hypothetical protein